MNNILTRIRSLKEKKFLTIWIIFICVTLLTLIANYPTYSSLELIFGDYGAAFKANELISDGYSPTVDFAYLYGLLPLVVSKVWFAIFGKNYQAVFLGVAICYLFSVTALAKIALSANLRYLGIIFIGISLPFYIFGNSPHFTYALEPIFILWAAVEHLLQKRGRTLVFLVFGYFTKPSISLVYAFIVLGTYARDFLKNRITIKQIFREISPAFLTLTFLLISLGIIFGVAPLVGTLLLAPIQGAEFYKAANISLLTSDFLYFPGVRLGYYIGNAGFWIISTIYLFASVIFLLYKNFILKEDGYQSNITDVIFSIAILHLIFSLSTPNRYPYILIVGVALLDSKNIKALNIQIKSLLAFLSVFLILGYYPGLSDIYKSWLEFNPSTSMVSLSSSSELKNEFSEILNYCQKKNVFILGTSVGGIDVFFPECNSPDAWWILKGVYNQTEIERINNQISRSDLLVIPKRYKGLAPFGDFNNKNANISSYQKELSKLQKYKEGNYFSFFIRSVK